MHLVNGLRERQINLPRDYKAFKKYQSKSEDWNTNPHCHRLWFWTETQTGTWEQHGKYKELMMF